MCVVITFSRLGINRVWLPILLVVSCSGKTEFPLCRRSRLRVWSRELGSAFPSRVSPLVVRPQAESGAYLWDSTPLSRFPLRFPLEPPCAIGLNPSSSGHATALPMAFTTENRHRPCSSQGSSKNRSFLFSYPHGPVSYTHLTLPTTSRV